MFFPGKLFDCELLHEILYISSLVTNYNILAFEYGQHTAIYSVFFTLSKIGKSFNVAKPVN